MKDKIRSFKTCLGALEFIDKLYKIKIKGKRIRGKLNVRKFGKKTKWYVRWRGK